MAKLGGLDTPMVSRNEMTLEVDPLWIQEPLTAEQARAANERRARIVAQLMQSAAPEDHQRALAFQGSEEIKPTEGQPYTLRVAVVRAVLSNNYNYAEKDPKTGAPKPESQEVYGQQLNIGIAFTRVKTGGKVMLTPKDIELIRRKAYELPLPPLISALLNEALDFAEGEEVRDKRRVTWEDPVVEEGLTPTEEPAG